MLLSLVFNCSFLLVCSIIFLVSIPCSSHCHPLCCVVWTLPDTRVVWLCRFDCYTPFWLCIHACGNTLLYSKYHCFSQLYWLVVFCCVREWGLQWCWVVLHCRLVGYDLLQLIFQLCCFCVLSPKPDCLGMIPCAPSLHLPLLHVHAYQTPLPCASLCLAVHKCLAIH
jgi:hypothetical protein